MLRHPVPPAPVVPPRGTGHSTSYMHKVASAWFTADKQQAAIPDLSYTETAAKSPRPTLLALAQNVCPDQTCVKMTYEAVSTVYQKTCRRQAAGCAMVMSS